MRVRSAVTMIVVMVIMMRVSQRGKERDKKISMCVEVFTIMMVMMKSSDLRLSEKTEKGRKNNRNKALE
jgi:hypothetical protein